MIGKLKKIELYLKRYLDMPKELVLSDLKIQNTNEDIVFYHHSRCKFLLSDEVTFFIKNNRIYNICITEYTFGIPLTIIFYHRDQDYTYTIIGLKNRRIKTY